LAQNPLPAISRLRRNPTTRKEHDHETANGHRRGDDMLRLGRSGIYRLIAAKQLESIKIGRCSADQSP
jgi:hypothetical protein